MKMPSGGPLPGILVPCGVTLLPDEGEDAGKVQTIGARCAQNRIPLEFAAELACRTSTPPGEAAGSTARRPLRRWWPKRWE